MKQFVTLTTCLLLILFAAELSSAQKPELVVQAGHSGWIHTVAFSPDGRTFASGSSDQTVRLWSVSTGAELLTLKGHSSSVLSIAFGQGGAVLAGGGDKEVKIWSTRTGKLWLSLSGHTAPVTSVAFSSDFGILASGSSDGQIKLWSLPSGRELRSLANVIEPRRPGELHPPDVKSIAFSPNGKFLVSGGIEHSVKVWDVNTGQVVHSMKDTSYEVNTVAFSGDGQTVLSGSSGEITVWDIATGQELRRLPATAGRINTFALSPDGASLATASYSGTIRLFDLKNGAERTLKGHSSDVLTLAFSPDSHLLVSGSSDRTIKLWNLATGVAERTFEGHSGGIFTDLFGRRGKIILAGSTDRAVKLWEISGKDALLRTIAPHDSEFLSLTFSPDGKHFVTSGANDPVRLWDVATGSEIRQLPWLSVKSDAPVPKAFSPDGRILAGEDSDHHIELYEVSSGVKIRTLESDGDGINSIAFSPNGKILATGGFKKVQLWDVASGNKLHNLGDHANIVHAIVFSPDGGKLLADSMNELFLWDVATGTKLQTLKGGFGENFTFSPDGKTIFGSTVKFVEKVMTTGVTQWDVDSGAELRSFQGHSSNINTMTFSPDAKTMATGSIDNTIKLWDLNSGKERRTLRGHSGEVLSVAFSADGRLLISSSDDLTIKIWDAGSGEELATLIALDEQDWAVITPDGLFDGSPAAWSRIAWRYIENPTEVTPVEAYFTEFYYPGLVSDIIAGNRPKAKTSLEAKDRKQIPVKLTTVEKIDEQTPVGSRNLQLQIEIEEIPFRPSWWPRSGARDVRLFRNGSLVKFWQGDLFKGGFGDEPPPDHPAQQMEGCLQQPRRSHLDARRSICTVTVPIVAGENNFTAYAFNHDNIKSSDATLVINGADSLKRQGTAYIVAVGINNYSNPQYNLKYAVADAEDFSTEVKRQQESLKRYAKVEIISLSDAQATKANIEQKLSELSTRAQPEDAVIVYFAGHGTAQGNQFYLIPHDLGYTGARDTLDEAGLKTILDHSISDRDLEKLFEGIDAGQLLLVIDACNSGQALEAEEKRRGPMNSKGLAQLAYEKGMYVLTAAQSYQDALEAAKFGHGFLTYALVEEGLKQGAADREPKDRAITLRELLDFATEEVPRMQDVNEKPEAKDKLQRPRVFYRRELEAKPFIIANLSSIRPSP